jgi:hypothetical protein
LEWLTSGYGWIFVGALAIAGYFLLQDQGRQTDDDDQTGCDKNLLLGALNKIRNLPTTKGAGYDDGKNWYRLASGTTGDADMAGMAIPEQNLVDHTIWRLDRVAPRTAPLTLRRTSWAAAT